MYLYLERRSFFHGLHPVTRLLLLLLMVTLPFFVPGVVGIAVLFCIYFALLLVARAHPNLAKFWKLLLIFWIATFLIWIVIPYLRKEPWSYEQAAMLATRIVSFVL